MDGSGQGARTWTRRAVPLAILGSALGCGPDPGVVAEPVPCSLDESLVPADALAAYRVDAPRVLVSALPHEDIVLPPALVDDALSALVCVHNSSSEPRDQVVDLFAIHTRTPDLHTAYVYPVEGAAWVDPAVSGVSPLGEPALDGLISSLDLTVTAEDFGDGIRARLDSLEPVDIWALLDALDAIPSVMWAEPLTIWGGGDNISATLEPQTWSLSYSHGWGDCPSGCIRRHDWDFEVSLDGWVRFSGHRGDSLEDAIAEL